MPAIQTAFPTRQDAGVVGSPAQSRYTSDSGVVQTAGGVPFSHPVIRGPHPSGRGLALMAAAGSILGLALKKVGGTVERHVRGDTAAYMIRGQMHVLADKAVAVDAQVRWNSVTGRYTDAAASGTVFELEGWRFDTPATAADQTTIIRRD